MREFLARAQAATDDGGRLPLGAMPGWEVFPMEAEGLPAWADMLPSTPLEELRERAGQVRAALAG